MLCKHFLYFITNSGPDEGSDRRLQQSLENDAIDAKYGFNRYKDTQEKIGWLLNMHPVSPLACGYCSTVACIYFVLQILPSSVKKNFG